jgi:hypothetical protein
VVRRIGPEIQDTDCFVMLHREIAERSADYLWKTLYRTWKLISFDVLDCLLSSVINNTLFRLANFLISGSSGTREHREPACHFRMTSLLCKLYNC